ncbi:MAG TPA: ATP-binding protein, partial [Chitinophagaceae bacterium]|nr:ATP-binding protein [Chitinophagaceae bacterium]
SLLRESDLSEEQDKYVTTIHRSGQNLLEIINDILDLSKIEAGMMRIESAPFSIRDIIHSTSTMFHSQILDKNLRIRVKIDETVPDMIEGDAMRLTQILVNLISNAIKFTNEGSITIAVSNKGITEDKIRVGIDVIDTGIGIEKDKQKNIFDRFQQAEDFVTRKFGGTGLGLSIVKNLVLLQHGEISVESELSKGSRFSLVIPYRVSYGAAAHPGSKNRQTNDMPDLGNVSILVAEDNELNQSLIKHLFTKWRLKFDIVGNGAEALIKSEKKKYDLVLMDIQMPVMDGYSATMQIRNKLKLKVPVIAMTAHAFTGEKEKCISYGMNDCISKPINEKELLTLIKRFTRFDYPVTPPQNGNANDAGTQYKYIDLGYMSQVSMGNKDYEKEITGLFINDIPGELDALKKSWDKPDIPHLRHLAHNMKTSVSVMGLDDKLHATLDSLEYDDLDSSTFTEKFNYLREVCSNALEEAKSLYENLKVNS